MEKNKSLAEYEEKSNEGKLIEIKNLIVSPMPMKSILLGDSNGLVDMIKMKKEHISAIFWNEDSITLMLKDNMEIAFHPEFHKSTVMFFTRQRKDRYDSEDGAIRVWEGEFEPIEFTKRDLLKFLNRYSSYFDEEIGTAIKSMRVTEKREQSETISLDSDSTKTVEEAIKTTNIPKKFSATMPLFDGLEVDLQFEAMVKTRSSDYARSKRNVIQVRCTNAREALRDAMDNILSKLPEDIPKYYGKLSIKTKR